jgi:hypothetical protein
MGNLYHFEVGLPDVDLPGRLHLDYGPHALEAAQRDKYGDLTRFLPRKLDVKAAQVVEMGTNSRGQVIHLLVRFPVFGTGLDIVLAVAPSRDSWFVKTVWGQETDDVHRTLDRSRYTRP